MHIVQSEYLPSQQQFMTEAVYAFPCLNIVPCCSPLPLKCFSNIVTHHTSLVILIHP